MKLRKATRKQAKLRIGLSWPSWSWKTYSALQLAYWITWDWEKIAIIDTENWSADLYSNLWDYLVLTLEPDYTPENYIEAIKTCENAWVEVIIIDSITHEWSWKWWCLEINEKIAQAKFKWNTWSAWSQTTPRHQKFLETIVNSSCHIITTARSKTETIQVEWKIKKIWMKDEQREWFEYEMTIMFNIDRENHLAIASKDRTNLFIDKDPFIITQSIWEEIKKWNLSWEKTKSKEEISSELFTEYFEKLQTCSDLDSLKEVFTEINWNKLKLNEQHLLELTELKDQIKNSLVTE